MIGIYNILILLHIVTSVVLLILVVFQKTSGEGLLTSTNKVNFMSGDEIAGLVTKATTFFVFLFIINTLAIAIIGSRISQNLNLSKVELTNETKNTKTQTPE
jgi:protein translocase SecG subunit